MKKLLMIASAALLVTACTVPPSSQEAGGGNFVSEKVFEGYVSKEVTDAELKANTGPDICAIKNSTVKSIEIQRNSDGSANFRITCN